MRVFLALALTVGLLFSPATADPTPADSAAYAFDETSSMTVYGSSNVRDWTMDVTQIDGTVQLNDAQNGPPSIQSIDATVPVDSMVSDKDKLQRHAHEALKKEKHPSISFTASDITVATADADSFSVVANGDLTIAGNTHVVQLTAKAFQKSDGSVAVAGTHRLKLSTYDVERPSLFFGTIKVDDPIRLGFDVLLRPTASSPSGTE